MRGYVLDRLDDAMPEPDGCLVLQPQVDVLAYSLGTSGQPGSSCSARPYKLAQRYDEMLPLVEALLRRLLEGACRKVPGKVQERSRNASPPTARGRPAASRPPPTGDRSKRGHERVQERTPPPLDRRPLRRLQRKCLGSV